MELKNKIIVLSGGSSGIGLEVAKKCAAMGNAVYSFDLMPFPEKIPNIHSIVADVSREKDMKKGIELVQGTIDILIINAGLMRRGDIFESTEDDFDALFDVHVKGSWLTLKTARDKLADRAMIVQMSSAHALRPQKDPGLYSLAKQTAVHLVENLQKDYANYRVKMIFPGPVDTPLALHGLTNEEITVKKKIMFAPKDVAGKIVELLESDTATRLEFDSRKDVWDYFLL